MFFVFLPSLTLKILKITSTMKAGAISLLCNIGRIKEKDFTLSKTIFCALKRRFRILKNKKNSLSEFFCEFCGDGGKVGMLFLDFNIWLVCCYTMIYNKNAIMWNLSLLDGFANQGTTCAPFEIILLLPCSPLK